MKTLRSFSLLAVAGIILSSCNNDEKNPNPVNEEELITRITLTFSEVGSPTSIEAIWGDPDGDGGNNPEVGDIHLKSNTQYSVNIALKDESKNPAVDITEEVEEEKDEHQFFFTDKTVSTPGYINYAQKKGATTPLNLEVTYQESDKDSNGIYTGLSTTFLTGAASSGKLVLTLKHQPDLKMNAPTPFGDPLLGESDIEIEFDVIIQ